MPIWREITNLLNGKIFLISFNFMSSWLSSTNAKEIGTLYLIFAVFAGMISKNPIVPAIKINLAICWENYLQNKIPILVKIFILKFYQQ